MSVPPVMGQRVGRDILNFKSKILRPSETTPELPARVAELAVVGLAQRLRAGMGAEKPLRMRLVNTVLHRSLHPSPRPVAS